MPSLPTGTVIFLFTGIEESTTLLQRLGRPLVRKGSLSYTAEA